MNKEQLQEVIKKLVNKNVNNIKEYSEEINNGKPFFNESDYQVIEGMPKYLELDAYGRSNGAIALVTSNTMPLLINKNLKYLPPYGWTDIIHNAGILMEAQSLDSEFNICEFCYNIQPNVEFSYEDGTIVKDNRNSKDIVKDKERQIKNTKISEINIEDETIPKRTGIWRDYIVNRKTAIYHLRGEKGNCYSIKNVNPKHLIETTTKEVSLKDLGLRACKKCN